MGHLADVLLGLRSAIFVCNFVNVMNFSVIGNPSLIMTMVLISSSF
jgi:hypothetical protein